MRPETRRKYRVDEFISTVGFHVMTCEKVMKCQNVMTCLVTLIRVTTAFKSLGEIPSSFSTEF